MAEKQAQGTSDPQSIRDQVKASLPTTQEMIDSGNGPQVEGSEENPSLEIPQATQSEVKPDESAQKENNIQGNASDYESEARMDGWVPKDEYKGDPKLWVNAEEWVSRAPLLHKISQQSKEMKNMAKTNTAMAEMLRNLTEKIDKEQATKILNNKREAIEQGDVAAAEKYEEEYNNVMKSSQEAAKNLPSSSQIPPEVEDFVERNKNWYNDKIENIPLKGYAIEIERQLSIQRPDLPLSQRLIETEKIIKEDPRYKSRFVNSNRDRAPMVEGKTAPISRAKDKITFAECPSDVKKVLREMKRADNRLDLDKMAQDLLNSGAIRYE